MAEIPPHNALADREKQRGNRSAKPDIAPLNWDVWDRFENQSEKQCDYADRKEEVKQIPKGLSVSAANYRQMFPRLI
jgi:hypothetical protein